MRRLSATAAIGLIRLYQLMFSPVVGGACRFQPSCSEYAVEAVRRHGVPRGASLVVRRVGRCHPLTAGGYDPVP